MSTLGNSFPRLHLWSAGWTYTLTPCAVKNSVSLSVGVMFRSERANDSRTSSVLTHSLYCRMLGQFEHLAEAYFSGFRFDVGERQLDRILSVEHDLDSFIAAIGLSKHELEAVIRDEGWLTLTCIVHLIFSSCHHRNRYRGRRPGHSIPDARSNGDCSGSYPKCQSCNTVRPTTEKNQETSHL